MTYINRKGLTLLPKGEPVISASLAKDTYGKPLAIRIDISKKHLLDDKSAEEISKIIKEVFSKG